MTIKLRYLSLLAAAALVACADAPKKPTTPVASAEATPVASTFVFAEFGKNASASNQGAELLKISYSEREGDAAVESIAIVGEVATLKGEIGNKKGSQYAGVAMQLTHGGNAVKDLSAYKSVRFKLASPTVGSLRLRIAGDDTKILNAGCYPIYIQAVKPELTEYTIALSKFAPEEYCGSNGRTLKSTIDKVMFMEVADTANTRNKPTEFSVGKIEYLQ